MVGYPLLLGPAGVWLAAFLVFQTVLAHIAQDHRKDEFMREDLHTPMHQTSEQLRDLEHDAYISNLIRQHQERLEQIERYYLQGKMTAEQVRNLLENTPPKKG